jgi:hypothetical protein
MSPPSADVMAVVTPFTRVTGMSSECGFTAVTATLCGLKSPSSCVSSPPGTEPISVSPRCVPASIIPGYTNSPVPSMTVASAGGVTFGPTASIRPARRMIVPF